MKKTLKSFLWISLCLFAINGCDFIIGTGNVDYFANNNNDNNNNGGDDDGNGDGNNDENSGISELHLSGQVWTADGNQFNGNRSIGTNVGTNALITGGQLNFTVAKPNNLKSVYNVFVGEAGWEDIFDNLEISDINTRSILLNLGSWTGGYWLYRAFVVSSISQNTLTQTEQEVQYLYVDRDVVISGKGKTETWEGVFDGIFYRETFKTTDLNIMLRTGWNIIYVELITSETETGDTETITETYSVSLGNPDNLRWWLSEWSSFSESTKSRARRK